MQKATVPEEPQLLFAVMFHIKSSFDAKTTPITQTVYQIAPYFSRTVKQNLYIFIEKIPLFICLRRIDRYCIIAPDLNPLNADFIPRCGRAFHARLKTLHHTILLPLAKSAAVRRPPVGMGD